MTIWPDESTLFGQLYGNLKASQLVFKYETTTHIQAFKWLFHGYLLICGPLWKAVLEIGNSLSLCYLTDLSKCTAMEKKLCVFHWQQICSTLCGAVIHKEILCSLPCFLSRLLQENFQEKWYALMLPKASEIHFYSSAVSFVPIDHYSLFEVQGGKSKGKTMMPQNSSWKSLQALHSSSQKGLLHCVYLSEANLMP